MQKRLVWALPEIFPDLTDRFSSFVAKLWVFLSLIFVLYDLDINLDYNLFHKSTLHSQQGTSSIIGIMEKQELAHLEQINTKQSDSPTGNELKQEQTLQFVDIENRHAFKGDDSDGKIEWTIRKILASAFLAMLYTGTLSSNRRYSRERSQGIRH
jgi:hypothetical protein